MLISKGFNESLKRLRRRVLSAAAVAVMLPGVAGTALADDYDATAFLKRATAAMGGTELKSLRITAAGTGTSFGQAYTPGTRWPKVNYPEYVRAINYDTGSFRDDIKRSRGEPNGGGALPPSGEQSVTQVFSAGHAWNMAGANPAAALLAINDRTHDLTITPHGILKAAARQKARLDWTTLGGRSLGTLTFSGPGAFSVKAYFNDDYLLERVESILPNPVLGDMAVATAYAVYRDYNGVKFPTRILQSQGGYPVLDLTVKSVEVNPAVDLPVPDAVKNAAERVAAEKVADGVWFLAGGSHNSVAIEMKDHVVLVEAPLYDGRSGVVIDEVKKLVPNKPIRFVVNSHTHFDHSGGLRTLAAAGATVVTQQLNKPYFEKVLANPNKLNPDRFAKSGKKARVVGVKDKMVLTDGSRTIELHHIAGNVHTETFLMAYLPKEKLLIEADAFTPGAPNAPVATNPAPAAVNLIENVDRLKLAVDKVLPLHGRVAPAAEMYRAAGRAM